MLNNKEYRGNMPERAEAHLKSLLLDDTFTWWGLAQSLKLNVPKNDFDELLFMLNNDKCR